MLKKSQPTEIKESLSPKPIGIWKISSSCSMHYMYLCEFKVCMNEMAGEPIGGLYVESNSFLARLCISFAMITMALYVAVVTWLPYGMLCI